MSDYEVGYGKPPLHSRFKKGVCPNPKGRGKAAFKADEIVKRVLNEPVVVHEKGKARKIPRWEVSPRRLFSMALRGDVGAAATLLRLRNSPVRLSKDILITIRGGLPDPNDPPSEGCEITEAMLD
jgi:hypothetical protein